MQGYKINFIFSGMMNVSLVTCILVLCLLTYTHTQQCDQPSDVARFDCHPEDGATQERCEARRCCWKSPIQHSKSQNLNDISVPFCYYPSDFPNYEVTSNDPTDFGQRIQIVKSQTIYIPNEILKLTVDLIYETQQRFRIRIYDPANKRYEVPIQVPVIEKKADMTDYNVVVNSKPFSLVVTRKSTGVTLFDSSVAPLIFADQFIKISTRLSSPLIYGLGEHRERLLLNVTTNWKRMAFWARDMPPSPNNNLYGDHRFHMNLEMSKTDQTNVHGQFLLNSNAMDVNLQPLPALTYTTIGGIIDLYIFTGSTPQNVIEQYWPIIGKPMLPPFWSLGFHLSRYGYDNIENLTAVIERMHDANFPYDVQWTDIDAMGNYLDYTYDKSRFHGLPDLVRELQSRGQHYATLIDPGISSTQPAGSYPPYDEGIKQDIFIKKAYSNDPIIGKVWPGPTVFPDFTNPNATLWWTTMAGAFHDIIPFDGVLIDMNELSNFVDGSVDGCTNSSLDNPPFTPHVVGGSLASKTLCPSARQYLSSQYNLHSMYGYFESQASNIALTKIRNKRPFILSRSTFAGAGQFTAHWTGDNHAAFDELYLSIPTILTLNMFGLTQIGAMICGFGGDATEELCTRWMQLGAFYPFMMNHNDMHAKDQDPAAFSREAQQIMKQALLMRYSLIPYWYTLHYAATTKAKSVLGSLFYEYPNDQNTYDIDQQFLVGPAILVSPTIVSNSTVVHAYIPEDVWYDYSSGVQLTTVGQYIDLDAPIQKINVHVRGGFIIPMQTPGANLILGRANPFQLLVALSSLGNATGSLYWDDGDSIDPIGTKSYNYLEFTLTSTNTLTMDALVANYKDSPMSLGTVTVLGLNRTVTNVEVNRQPYSNFRYYSANDSLLVYGLTLNMLSPASQTIQWTTSF